MGFRSTGDIEMFNMVVDSLVVGIAFLWLVAHKLGRCNSLGAFFLALLLMAAICLVGILSYLGTGFSLDAVWGLIVLAIQALAILISFVLAGWCCRKRYGPVRFMLWLAVWIVAACIVSMLVAYSIMFFIQQVSIPILTLLFMTLIVGSVFAACLYVIVLPFMILAFRSPLFRERFYACLRLKSLPAASGLADMSRLNEQISDAGTPENSGSV